MRRGFIVLLALAVPLAAMWTQLAAAEGTREAPTVRIAQWSPLVIAGDRYRSREALVIRVTTDSGVVTRRTRASLGGRFVARFEAVRADRCSGDFSVVVRGGNGSFARKQLPQLLCPPGSP